MSIPFERAHAHTSLPQAFPLEMRDSSDRHASRMLGICMRGMFMVAVVRFRIAMVSFLADRRAEAPFMTVAATHGCRIPLEGNNRRPERWSVHHTRRRHGLRPPLPAGVEAASREQGRR